MNQLYIADDDEDTPFKSVNGSIVFGWFIINYKGLRIKLFNITFFPVQVSDPGKIMIPSIQFFFYFCKNAFYINLQ